VASLDHTRRRIVVSPAQLGLLAAAAGEVEDRLAGRPEALRARAELERAGILGRGAPGWAHDLAGAVARPDARLEIDARRADGTGVPHRAWVRDGHAVIAREEPAERIELAIVPRGLVALAIARALAMEDRPAAPAPVEADAAALPFSPRMAWRFTTPEHDEPLTVFDSGDALWISRPAGEGHVRLTPTALAPLLERVAGLLGAQAASAR
jgi:hypothetical protein